MSKGFTLIELLVVVIIIGVLTSIALPQYRKSIDRSKAAEAMQLLPAIFEARERWMIENGCQWTGTNAHTCTALNKEPTFNKLDIETKGSVDESGNLITPNFTYTLRAAGTTDQPCVSATPRWADRVSGATIYYKGDKFSCNGSTAGCDILNVSTKRNNEGELVYEGCQ